MRNFWKLKSMKSCTWVALMIWCINGCFTNARTMLVIWVSRARARNWLVCNWTELGLLDFSFSSNIFKHLISCMTNLGTKLVRTHMHSFRHPTYDKWQDKTTTPLEWHDDTMNQSRTAFAFDFFAHLQKWMKSVINQILSIHHIALMINSARSHNRAAPWPCQCQDIKLTTL